MIEYCKRLPRYTEITSGFWVVIGIGVLFSSISGSIVYIYPIIMNKAVFAFKEGDLAQATIAFLGFFGVQILQELFSLIGQLHRGVYTVDANQKTLLTLYKRLLNYPLPVVDRHKRSGELYQKLMDTWRLGSVVVESMLGLLSIFVQIFVMLIVVSYYNLSTAIALFLLFSLYITLTLAFAKNIATLTNQSLNALSSLGGVLFEGVRRLTSVKALGAINVYVSKVSSEVNRFCTSEKSRTYHVVTYMGVSSGLIIFLQAAAFAVVLSQVMNRGIEIGTAIALAYVSIRILSLAKSTNSLMQEFKRGEALLGRFVDMVDQEIEQDTQRSSHIFIQQTPPMIQFKNVSFAYEEDLILNDVTFKIKPLEQVAIVGVSGVGKSTILKLILGLYRPTTGKILIDGKDLAEIELNEYRAQVGIVLQSDSIFPGTIRDNLEFGLSKKVDESDAFRALRTVKLADRVSQFPDGLNEWVKDTSFSGGEQQRLILARTFLRDAKLVLMDEPTSALDPETETEVRNLICDSMSNATSITVAHRLSTVQRSDRIMVLDSGTVKEFGTHSELLEKRGIYNRLFDASIIG